MSGSFARETIWQIRMKKEKEKEEERKGGREGEREGRREGKKEGQKRTSYLLQNSNKK